MLEHAIAEGHFVRPSVCLPVCEIACKSVLLFTIAYWLSIGTETCDLE